MVTSFLLCDDTRMLRLVCCAIDSAVQQTVCCLRSNVVDGRQQVVTNRLIVHVHGGVPMGRITPWLRPTVAALTLDSMDGVFERLSRCVQHCNTSLLVTNHRHSTPQPQNMHWCFVNEFPRRPHTLTCVFKGSVILLWQVTALRDIFCHRVHRFSLQMTGCLIELNHSHNYSVLRTTAVKELWLRFTDTIQQPNCDNAGSTSNNGVSVYLILDCLLHRLVALQLCQLVLKVQHSIGMCVQNWLACMNTVLPFLKRCTTQVQSVDLEFLQVVNNEQMMYGAWHVISHLFELHIPMCRLMMQFTRCIPRSLQAHCKQMQKQGLRSTQDGATNTITICSAHM